MYIYIYMNIYIHISVDVYIQICIYTLLTSWLAWKLVCRLVRCLACWVAACSSDLPACWRAGCLAYVLARSRKCSIGYLLAGMVACSLARSLALVAGLLTCYELNHDDSDIQICGWEHFRSAEPVARPATINQLNRPASSWELTRNRSKHCAKVQDEIFPIFTKKLPWCF